MPPLSHPPGFYVPEEIWIQRFATRARRVEDVLARAQFQYLVYWGCCPVPPSCTDRLERRVWERSYINWRDGGLTLAACWGYVGPS